MRTRARRRRTEDGWVEEVVEERVVAPVPADVPRGVDPYAIGIGASLLVGLVTLGLLIALLVSPGSFGIATTDQVDRVAAKAQGARGPAGPPGPRGAQGPQGPAGASATDEVAALRADLADRAGQIAGLEQRISTLTADVARLCAATSAGC